MKRKEDSGPQKSMGDFFRFSGTHHQWACSSDLLINPHISTGASRRAYPMGTPGRGCGFLESKGHRRHFRGLISWSTCSFSFFRGPPPKKKRRRMRFPLWFPCKTDQQGVATPKQRTLKRGTNSKKTDPCRHLVFSTGT